MKLFPPRAGDVLRGSLGSPPGGLPPQMLARLVTFVIGYGILYGAVMGTFGAEAGVRIGQVVSSASKVPLLLLATFLLSLPSFFVLNSLFGLQSDFPQALRALLATQASLTIILASLAPLTALWYVSSANYDAAVLFNGLMFAAASFAAQWPLRRLYRPLVARNRKHRWLLRIWIIVYAFVGIQMGWILRPFVGDPKLPVRFVRGGAWENAYVILARTLWSVFGPRS